MQDPVTAAEKDKALMKRIASGDPPAFRAFVETFQRPLLALGCRMLRDAEEAEDLCQDVFLQALKKAGSFRGEGSLRGWLFRIAVNTALNLRRKARPLPAEAPDESPAPTPAPPSILEKEEEAALVREAVASLPERQRAAVILLRYEKLTYREIAEALDCGMPAVVSLIHRAHRALAEKLSKKRE
ncbi:MAG: RNA polymerase sigma factor [Planctomycetota bacterium]|jgi:RNA polymerase sigma-70 factor (ECF subfamily)